MMKRLASVSIALVGCYALFLCLVGFGPELRVLCTDRMESHVGESMALLGGFLAAALLSVWLSRWGAVAVVLGVLCATFWFGFVRSSVNGNLTYDFVRCAAVDQPNGN